MLCVEADGYHGGMTERIDQAELEARWRQNEAELQRLANAPGLDREIHASRIDELLGEQDRIEFELGCTLVPGLRRWSGML